MVENFSNHIVRLFHAHQSIFPNNFYHFSIFPGGSFEISSVFEIQIILYKTFFYAEFAVVAIIQWFIYLWGKLE